ncbi:hypothetical protein MHB77_31395 [Paenibacillus sp. FSL K6-3166]|uniref:hypothetical protein n=1 Tax=Paenibacillus sp. FSL K6-3166 TaxID=2921492 RepID=UPI0030FA7E85
MSYDVSPFSNNGNDYILKWGHQPPENTALPVRFLNTGQKKVLEVLKSLQWATKNQLALILNPGNLRKGKKNVDALCDKGYLVQHQLVAFSNSRYISFYTLSNPMRALMTLPKGPRSNVSGVLRRLVVAQMFLRFYQTDPNTTLEEFPDPFDGVFYIQDMQFRVAVLRDKFQRDRVYKHLKVMEEKMRTFIVVPDWPDANMFLELKKQSDFFRVTTDHNLLKESLAHCFWKAGKEGWEEEYIAHFEIRVETDANSVRNENDQPLLPASDS